MPVTFLPTCLEGVMIVQPRIFEDSRGWFCESWSQRDFEEAGHPVSFCQDNHSYSKKKGVLRGLHCQIGEDSQAKLARCTRGAVLDVAVDAREGSPTYLQWVAVELSEENHRMLLIPRGFLHGFLTLRDGVEFLYKTDRPYAPGAERSVRWNDPVLGIDWGVSGAVLLDRDRTAPDWEHSGIHFPYTPE